jgi:regulator of sirC expression with transglutaminase-like and TPR domain
VCAYTEPMQYGPSTSLDYFASLVADDAAFPLTEVALALAQDEFPDLDIQGALAEIDALAERLKRRLPADCTPVHRLRMLNRYFFRELGFAGNVNDYYDPYNSCLNIVLQSRRGIPISLAVLYIELAQQVGLPARGVSFPGHFLVKLRMPEGEVIIDPFSGLSLSREELEERLLPYKRQQGLTGDYDIPLGLFLQSASPRDVIARMLRNLKEIHRTHEDWPRMVAVLERLVILLPQALDELRDRGLAYAEMGRRDEAIADLADYVQRARQATDRLAMAERLESLRGSTPRLH